MSGIGVAQSPDPNPNLTDLQLFYITVSRCTKLVETYPKRAAAVTAGVCDWAKYLVHARNLQTM